MFGHLRKMVALTAALLLAACAADQPTPQIAANDAVSANFERDRAAILAMAGDFSVTFDFRETVPLKAGYKVKDAYVTHAQEVVRVIEDRGDFISMQHILLVGGEEKFPIKHWRQDWHYQPTSITRYVGGNSWDNIDLDAEDVRGQWAQFVYQVDDGPRYAGLGKWRYNSGFPEWSSDPSWRPLPRRDATKRTDYHAIEAVNRHAITPDGWVHEQDNTKLVLVGDAPTALVREVGVNTYVKANDLQSGVAMAYWDKTKDLWKAVRAEWTRLEKETPGFGLTIQGEPQEMYMQILGVATGLEEGSTTLEQAQKDVLAIMAEYTATDLKPLQTRLAEIPRLDIAAGE